MKKNISKKIVLLFILNFVFLNFVSAEDITQTPEVVPSPVVSTNIHLKIIGGESSLYDSNIDVTACDSDDDITTPDTITAYCAVLQSNLTSKWNWAWKPGAFVDSINDIAGYTSKDEEGKDVYHYWSWSSNGTPGMTGLNEYIPVSGDIILLEFIDPKPEVIISTPEVVPPPVVFTNIHLKIIGGESSLYDSNIDVTACDSDDDITTPDTITAYCAVLQSNLTSKWNWAWKPGAFVDSINDIAGYTSKDEEGKDVYHYWSWSSNGTPGMTGLNEYIPVSGDIILLEFIDPKPEVIISTPEVVPPPVVSSGGGSSVIVSEKVFSILNALNFLSKNQNADGAFSSPMYTDWIALAAASGNSSNLKRSISNYLKLNKVESDILTDYERRAMALMSLGINPYTETEVNYIEKIINSFDGTQFGDASLLNDDIFALIVLKNAGYNSSDDIIKKDVNYIVSEQVGNLWGSVDLTVAAIQSLRGLEDIEGVPESIFKAETYLISIQESDGGFGNSSSTAWVLQSLFSNNKIVEAENYLSLKQQEDGGMEDINENINNRIWITAYTIPAILHKEWSSILENFPKSLITKNAAPSDIKEEIKIETVLPEIKIEEVKKEQSNIEVSKDTVLKSNKVKSVISKKQVVLEEKQFEDKILISKDIITEKSNKSSLFRRIWSSAVYTFLWLLDKLSF